MDKLHVSDVEAAGAAGVSLKNITLHRGPDGALLDGYFLRDAEGRWTYTGGLRTGDEVAQVAGLRMSPWAGTALDEVLRRVQAEPFMLVQSGDEFYIDGLPSGPATVLRSTAEDDDAPGLVRAHLADHPLIGGNGPTMHAAAVSVLHSLRKNAADPIGWLRACAEECAAELERIQSDEDNCEMYEAEEMWEAVERAYLNAARIVEASAAAKARTV